MPDTDEDLDGLRFCDDPCPKDPLQDIDSDNVRRIYYSCVFRRVVVVVAMRVSRCPDTVVHWHVSNPSMLPLRLCSSAQTSTIVRWTQRTILTVTKSVVTWTPAETMQRTTSTVMVGISFALRYAWWWFRGTHTCRIPNSALHAGICGHIDRCPTNADNFDPDSDGASFTFPLRPLIPFIACRHRQSPQRCVYISKITHILLHSRTRIIHNR